MSHVDAPAETAQDAMSEGVTGTYLHGRWLLLTRIGWGVLAVLALGMFVVSLPGYIAQLQTLCTGAACSNGQLSYDALTTLEHVGLSLGEYVTFNVALILMATLIGCILALLLVLRRSDDWMALLVAFMLVYLVSGSIANPMLLSHWVGSALASVLFSILGGLGFFSAVLVFYLFPDGRFVPRWTRWVMLGVIGASLPFMIIPYTPYTSTAWLTVVSTLIFSCALISLVIAQIYRYRGVSSPLQRQQTKWVVYILTVTILLVVGFFLLQLLVPTVGQTSSLFYSISNTIVNLLFYVLLPISFGIAILRYHLYDIDVIINRTLVYGTLTVFLTVLYVGLVIGLQGLLRGIISQDSSVAIVISTLAIAALFHPLRRRIQQVIDRRFYRRKYDAAKTLETFSASLRHEVDLSKLSEQLVAVVQETMQPVHVSLWLRPSEHDGKHRASWRNTPPVSKESR